MMRWNDFMLKTKLFLSFSAVLLFLVTMICFIFYSKNVSDIKSQTYAMLDTITRQLGRTIDLYMQDVEKLSVSVIGDTAIQSGLLDYRAETNSVERSRIQISLNQRLLTHAQQKPFVQSIYLFTKERAVFYVSKTSSRPDMLSSYDPGFLDSETWYKEDRYSYKNKFILLPTSGSPPEFAFVRNVTNVPTRDIIGYMMVRIDVNAFRNMLVPSVNNEVERNMRMLIVTGDGRAVYDNKGERTGWSDVGLDPAIFREKGRVGDTTWNGRKYLYSYERSAYTRWNTITLIPYEVILKEQRRTLLIVVAVGMAATLLIAAVSYMLAYHITLPLQTLIKKMVGVEVGDFSQRMQVTGNNEIGRLSHIYNKMLDSISRLIREVYEAKLAEKSAQLSALQAQINPHFLFNTLNIMKSISRVKGVEEVAEMSESLGQLFQYTMRNLQHPVPLREELLHISNYMNIQKHRFGERFELECSVPEALQRAAVLKLTIQPLIENAIIHGLSRRKSGGAIRLSAQESEGLLTIEVTDDGAGVDSGRLFELEHRLAASDRSYGRFEEAGGIGLVNIHQRIRLFYGQQYGVRLAGSPGNGMTVRLELPFIEHRSGVKGAEANEHLSGGG